MRPLPKHYAVVALAAATAMGLAACGGSSNTSTSSGSAGKPVTGGTLHIVAASGPDHWDTVSAYYTADYMVERAYTRQLLQYPTVPSSKTGDAGWMKNTAVAPDIATAVPSESNGGITNGGKTYTFHIKKGVMWNTSPARQVTADDFIREFKAFFNPVSPVGNPVYYTSTIAGLQQYSNAETAFFAKKSNKPTAANIAKFQNTHNISGLSAPDPMTLKITLSQPASDFLYMLAMPFASARPVEYDKYVPNSATFNQHTISDGPYQITSLVPGKSATLSRNPAWKQSTDTLRHAYVNSIVITEGVDSAATQLADMQAGSQDLPMDTNINPPSIPGLVSSGVKNFQIAPWSNTFPYLVFNLRSPDANGAMTKVAVRQALEYGVNKVAASRVYGGTAVAKPLNAPIPPGNVGYTAANMYPNNNNQGNPSKCKSMLASAGYPNGLTLTYMYPNDTVNTNEFTAIQASLKNCGVTLKGKGEPGSSFFVDMGNAPENNKPNAWDIGQVGWIPDWFGNNGRTIIQALFQGPNCVVNTVNYGCVNDSTVNSLIKQAESATSTSAAASAWSQASNQIMKQAYVVPLVSQNFPLYASARVKGVNFPTALFAPNIGDADVTNLWLSK